MAIFLLQNSHACLTVSKHLAALHCNGVCESEENLRWPSCRRLSAASLFSPYLAHEFSIVLIASGIQGLLLILKRTTVCLLLPTFFIVPVVQWNTSLMHEIKASAMPKTLSCTFKTSPWSHWSYKLSPPHPLSNTFQLAERVEVCM